MQINKMNTNNKNNKEAIATIHDLPYFNNQIITNYTYFILIDSKENRIIGCPNMGVKRICKNNIDLRYFIGKRLNSFYEYDTETKEFTVIDSSVYYKENLCKYSIFLFNIYLITKVNFENLDYDNEKITKANNKEIYSSDLDFQKAKNEVVLSLKEKGLKGNELINELKLQNENLNKRTILSQEKIIRKMEKRHKYQIHIADCSLFNLLETYFLDYFLYNSILKMRYDTVGTIMQNCKFINDSNTLILDNTSGFITSAVAGRSSGVLISLYNNRPLQRNILFFNYNKEIKNKITYMSSDFFNKNLSNSISNENNFYNFHKSFDNLIICSDDESNICEIVFKYILALKNSGNIIVYAKDKEVFIYYY